MVVGIVVGISDSIFVSILELVSSVSRVVLEGRFPFLRDFKEVCDVLMADRAATLREQAARITLRHVRAQGHSYVDIREEGKRFIFFCNLCLAPCYSDKVLFDHLRGQLHAERYAAAKLTLFGPNPWPFNDGFVFFDNNREQDSLLNDTSAKNVFLLEGPTNDKSFSLVSSGGNNQMICTGSDCSVNLQFGEVVSDGDVSSADKNTDEYCDDIVIPNVLLKEETSGLRVKFVGLGLIAANLYEKGVEASDEAIKIWCEWLGKKSLFDEDISHIPEHDFAIVTFRYSYELAKKGWDDDDVAGYLPSTGPVVAKENKKISGRKRKKSFSDPEDVSLSMNHQSSNSQCDSSEDSLGSNSPYSNATVDNQFLHSRVISNRAMRRDLRRRQRAAAERMCDICQQKMLPGKDVASIMNMKTGKLACSSRNVNGKFHPFHTSCLVHWILLCEVEILKNCAAGSGEAINVSSCKGKGRSRKKVAAKSNENEMEGRLMTIDPLIHSTFCPECMGTGTTVGGEELESPRMPLSQLFRYKIDVIDAQKAWMKNPEVLDNCSTGLHFPPKSLETRQETISPLKLLRFYSSDT